MLDQFTVMICSDIQKSDEQTMGSVQPRNQVADRRAEPDEQRAADSSVVTGERDPSVDFVVPLDDPNEEIAEQWQEGLHDWYICRDDQFSVEPARISRDVSPTCLKRRFVSACTNSQTSTPRECVTPTVPQETLVSCFLRSHQLLHGSNTVSVYLTCLDCRHHTK